MFDVLYTRVLAIRLLGVVRSRARDLIAEQVSNIVSSLHVLVLNGDELTSFHYSMLPRWLFSGSLPVAGARDSPEGRS